MNVHVSQSSALGNLTLTEAADAVARGDVTSVELTRSALSAIAARDKIVNSFIWLDEEEAMTTAAALDAMQRAGRRARSAARRAAGAQGHVLSRRQALHLRIEDPRRLSADLYRDRDRTARGCRIDLDRRTEHGRVRAERDRPQPALRSLRQSVERRLLSRRLLLGLRRLGRRATGLCSARLRHRRIDPPAGIAVRRHRHQGDADAGLALRRDAAVVLRRQCRPSRPLGARLRPHHERHRRPRSARSHVIQRTGAGL